MISCQTFRTNIRPGADDVNLLEHLRSCDACLDHAVSIDPDFFFRSLGGSDHLVPPGGVDNFVSEVMTQVRLRQAEGSSLRPLPLNRYLRAAAALVFVIAGTTGIYRFTAVGPAMAPIASASAHIHQPLTTKAVVETYQSQNATIVEIPTASASDAKVVMIYDDSLPADL